MTYQEELVAGLVCVGVCIGVCVGVCIGVCVCVCVHMCLYAVPTIAVVYCFVLYTQCLTVLEPCVSVVCAYMYMGVCVCVNALIELNDYKFHNPWV